MADEQADHEKTVGPDINEAGEAELKRREDDAKAVDQPADAPPEHKASRKHES